METLPGSPTHDESSFCSVQLTVDQGLPLRPLVNAPICPRLKLDSETSLDLETQGSETGCRIQKLRASYSEAILSDSETNLTQKLVCRIRNLIVGFRNYSSGFRNYFVGFRSRIQTPPYLETILSYPETILSYSILSDSETILSCSETILSSKEVRIHFQKLIHGSERRVLGLVQGCFKGLL